MSIFDSQLPFEEEDDNDVQARRKDRERFRGGFPNTCTDILNNSSEQEIYQYLENEQNLIIILPDNSSICYSNDGLSKIMSNPSENVFFACAGENNVGSVDINNDDRIYVSLPIKDGVAYVPILEMEHVLYKSTVQIFRLLPTGITVPYTVSWKDVNNGKASDNCAAGTSIETYNLVECDSDCAKRYDNKLGKFKFKFHKKMEPRIPPPPAPEEVEEYAEPPPPAPEEVEEYAEPALPPPLRQCEDLIDLNEKDINEFLLEENESGDKLNLIIMLEDSYGNIPVDYSLCYSNLYLLDIFNRPDGNIYLECNDEGYKNISKGNVDDKYARILLNAEGEVTYVPLSDIEEALGSIYQIFHLKKWMEGENQKAIYSISWGDLNNENKAGLCDMQSILYLSRLIPCDSDCFGKRLEYNKQITHRQSKQQFFRKEADIQPPPSASEKRKKTTKEEEEEFTITEQSDMRRRLQHDRQEEPEYEEEEEEEEKREGIKLSASELGRNGSSDRKIKETRQRRSRFDRQEEEDKFSKKIWDEYNLKIGECKEELDKALYISAYNLNNNDFEELLKRGANISYVPKNVLLRYALVFSDLGFVEQLVNKSNVNNPVENEGTVPIVNARELPIVIYLIGVGADPNATDSNGNTLLHKSVESQNEEIMQYLLDNPNIDTSIQNANGETAEELVGDNDAIKSLFLNK